MQSGTPRRAEGNGDCPHTPMFSYVWQGKDLWRACLYVWQAKGLWTAKNELLVRFAYVWQGKELTLK